MPQYTESDNFIAEQRKTPERKDFQILTPEEAKNACYGVLPKLVPLEAFDVTQDDLTRLLYEACIQIERLPASEQQTRCISLVSHALRLYCMKRYEAKHGNNT